MNHSSSRSMSELVMHGRRHSTGDSSDAGSRPVREVGEDDHHDDEGDAAGSHHAGVGDVPRAFRFEAGDGGDRRDDDSQAKPDEPVHDRWLYKRRARRPQRDSQRGSALECARLCRRFCGVRGERALASEHVVVEGAAVGGGRSVDPAFRPGSMRVTVSSPRSGQNRTSSLSPSSAGSRRMAAFLPRLKGRVYRSFARFAGAVMPPAGGGA
jgi:hypothetical protein